MNTAKRLIHRFGGISKMSGEIDVLVPTINNWSRSGIIPPWHHQRILKKAKKLGIELTADDLIF